MVKKPTEETYKKFWENELRAPHGTLVTMNEVTASLVERIQKTQEALNQIAEGLDSLQKQQIQVLNNFGDALTIVGVPEFLFEELDEPIN